MGNPIHLERHEHQTLHSLVQTLLQAYSHEQTIGVTSQLIHELEEHQTSSTVQLAIGLKLACKEVKNLYRQSLHTLPIETREIQLEHWKHNLQEEATWGTERSDTFYNLLTASVFRIVSYSTPGSSSDVQPSLSYFTYMNSPSSYEDRLYERH
ncbi:hypothetical protein N781_06615 [Pontibacillus halophilus JSM 076056 = DSM 19796]|uniref:Uncharacterized protein n=1 Tax=Pontibacillus halophilus JSM 076056 = DSM 19796 TaxID=1385510 RepID=A0A0A5GI16_9BACI|nr:hypothetical protein [Pontibacillus halophilus]KGX90765.1 hypothetical protein N781_06615 [Pontibacillus halophilus JSM 076056 = DSM 19796]